MSDELDVLRTKLLLLEAQALDIGPPYHFVITWVGCDYFRFKEPHNKFYPTEREALEDGLRIALSGEGVDQPFRGI